MKRVLLFLGSLRLAVVCILLLLILVFVGTLYQVDNGIHYAQQRIFYSWVVWTDLGGFPLHGLPGGLLVMTVFTVNLVVSMLLHFRLGWRMAGVWMAHSGVLLLMLGGAYTRLTGIESSLLLAEGQSSNVSQHNSEWEFALWPGRGTVRDVSAVDTVAAVRAPVAFADLGVELTVTEYLPNAAAYEGEPAADAPFSPSKIVRLDPIPRDRSEPARDLPGAVVTLAAAGESKKILLFGDDRAPATVSLGGREISLSLRRIHYPLPVLVKLVKFTKETYANSRMASAYSSVITVQLEDSAPREVVVAMNEPFRHLGWTFYQASYEEGRPVSVFSVTRNFARRIPHLASIITFLGMALHFGIRLVGRRKEEKA